MNHSITSRIFNISSKSADICDDKIKKSCCGFYLPNFVNRNNETSKITFFCFTLRNPEFFLFSE